MASIIQNGRLFWLTGLPSVVTKKVEGGLQQWILNGNYVIAAKPQKKRFEVFPVDAVVPAFAVDISKLSCAAIESASSVAAPQHDHNATSWIIIQSYYAAYFAANALMRFYGFSCSNLNIEHTTTLKSMSMTYGFPIVDRNVLKTGVYYFEYDRTDNKLMAQSLDSVSGGVHGQFWFAFLTFTNALIDKIRASSIPTAEKALAEKELRQLQQLLTSSISQNGNWLSTVRNAVNYRFEYGCWYPYATSPIDADTLLDVFNESWKEAPNFQSTRFGKTDLERFITTCGLLVALCKKTVEEISDGGNLRKQFKWLQSIPLLHGLGF